MCDSFQTINNWHCQIIGGVALVSRASSVMRCVLTSVENWVAQTLNLVLHVKFSPDAESSNFSRKHIVEVLKILLDSVLAVFGLDSFISLLLHDISWSVVSVCISISNELAAVLLNLFEIIRTVRNLIGSDAKSL